jgi:hypothetical protein
VGCGVEAGSGWSVRIAIVIDFWCSCYGVWDPIIATIYICGPDTRSPIMRHILLSCND